VTCPIASHAQPTTRIGVLVPINPEPFWSKFRTGLRGLGYIEGQNISFVFRSADGVPDVLPQLATELVNLKVDIITAWLTPAATAARQATTEIPIVMVSVGDPVETGLISSLARPGGNVTGLSSTGAESYAKTLELIREALPSVRRVTVLANRVDPFSRLFVEHVEEGGHNLSILIQPIDVRGTGELDSAFAAMNNDRPDAIIIQDSLPIKVAAELALKHRLPLVGSRLVVEAGGLISFSANQAEMYRRAAFYIHRILRGTKPAELPVEQPTRYEILINLKTAKALGLDIPPTLLARADEVFE
jgi:putative ABC transport system substrate-binding protein